MSAGIQERRAGGKRMYRTFDGKKYKAYQEYTTKTEARKDQAKIKAQGYLARIFYSVTARALKKLQKAHTWATDF